MKKANVYLGIQCKGRPYGFYRFCSLLGAGLCSIFKGSVLRALRVVVSGEALGSESFGHVEYLAMVG